MDTPTVEEIELDIEHAKKFVELKNALDRLEKNPDFKLLVMEGYFKDNAIRLVEAKSNPHLQSEEHQNAIIKSIDGIGSFKEFLRSTAFQGVQAEDAIKESNILIEELAEEGEI